MDCGLLGELPATSSGCSLRSRRIAAIAPQYRSGRRRIHRSDLGRLQGSRPAQGQPLEPSAFSRLLLSLVLRPRNSRRTAHGGIERKRDALEELPGCDGTGTNHGGLGAALARFARQLVRYDSRFCLYCGAARDGGSPAEGRTTESRNRPFRQIDCLHFGTCAFVCGKGHNCRWNGQSNVHRIGVDNCFRMDPQRLAQTIGDDVARGRRPFFAVATVGTTSSTALDPVVEIADICRANGIWLHVDGAYGGSFGLVPECRHFLDGVERADSFVVNPHKGMMVPLDCSLFYTAHPDILRDAFSLEAEYLRTDVEAVDFMDYGLALGRRFRALKLWFVLRYFGRNGLVANLRESLGMAAWLADKIAGDTRLELAAPVTMGLVCCRVRRGDSATRELMRRINGSRDFFVSQTALDGKVVMRVAIGNIRTRQQDIEELWSSILRISWTKSKRIAAEPAHLEQDTARRDAVRWDRNGMDRQAG